LKIIARARFPELYYDSAGTVQLLERVREHGFSTYIYNVSGDFSRADQETARAASGALVVKVVPYDETRDILVLARPLGEGIEIINILTTKEGSPFSKISEPLMSAAFSNGVASLGQIGTVRHLHSSLPKPERERLAGRFIVDSRPDPDILSLFGEEFPLGVICDTGGATAHLAVVLRGERYNIPVLSATGSSAYRLLFEGMPIQVIENDIYAFLYLYREGDIGISSSGLR
ncbi:MAG: hypothetical protein PHQ54_03595, partial [Candidatus Omnitrophica bacterium]|nr:hypothetical protein [Candidatus Omnitrophota bacterium]